MAPHIFTILGLTMALKIPKKRNYFNNLIVYNKGVLFHFLYTAKFKFMGK